LLFVIIVILLIIDGLKISGAAFRHTKVRSLHHGTVLLDVNLQALQNYLTPSKAKLESKGVASVSARVLNLQTRFPNCTHDAVCDSIVASFFEEHGSNCDVIDIDDSIADRERDIAEVAASLEDWDWRFGKEPKFTHQLETRFDWGSFSLLLTVEKGQIASANVYSDALDTVLVESIQKSLPGIV
jgi:lipoate-protein ligase A